MKSLVLIVVVTTPSLIVLLKKTRLKLFVLTVRNQSFTKTTSLTMPMILPVHVLIITSKSSSILQTLVPMDTKIVSNIKFLQLNTDKSLASTLNILQLAVDTHVDVLCLQEPYFYVNHIYMKMRNDTSLLTNFSSTVST